MAVFSLSNVCAMQDEKDLLAQAYAHQQLGDTLAKDANEEIFTTFENSSYQKAKDHYLMAHNKLLQASKEGNRSARCLIRHNYETNIAAMEGKKYELKKSCSIGKEITGVCDVIRQAQADGAHETVHWWQVLKETYVSMEKIEDAKESILGKATRKLTSSFRKFTE
jgi:hypothetical protein